MNEPTRNYFVAVHIGAGYHSPNKTASYRLLCESICTEVGQLLAVGVAARKAVAHAILLLEVNIRNILTLISDIQTFAFK